MDPIDWLRFPPLSALRALEVTARIGSFSAAGRALNVTHAAVAQQIRGLEAHLGCALVARDGRSMSLTAEGQVLADACNEGFLAIEGALRTLRSAQTESLLAATMTPIFAEKWLMPRLKAFWQRHPEVTVTIRPDHRVVDLRRERIDIGIRFGKGRWPGVQAEYLTSARFMVVASPGLLKGVPELTPALMQSMHWITEDRLPEALTWLLEQGIDIRDRATLDLPTEELALSAARQGIGLYVASAALIEEDLRSGALTVVLDPGDDDPGYYIVTPGSPAKASVRAFVRWLKSSV